jgi:hypothetical protein
MYLIGKEYGLRTHVENLSAFIEGLGLRDITFVVQGWGGPIAADETWLHAYSAKVRRNVKALSNSLSALGKIRCLTPDTFHTCP